MWLTMEAKAVVADAEAGKGGKGQNGEGPREFCL